MLEIIEPTEYVWPQDGYDHCESCNYLSKVHTTYVTDDGESVVPLCADCANEMGVN
jgi:hypothetical protein